MNAMTRLRIVPGETIIRQGDPGDKFYIVEKGECSVFVNDNEVARIEPTGAFGELALLYNSPRAATVKADTSCVLWALNRTMFRMLLATTSSASVAERCEFLTNVPVLSNLTNNQISKIAGAMKSEDFSRGAYIIREGEEGEKFYIVKHGEVVATKVNEAGVEVELGVLKEGDYFGEMALLHNDRRHANCVAATATEVYSLDRASFNLLLGPLMDIMTATEFSRNEHNAEVLSTAAAAAPAAVAQENKKFDIKMPLHKMDLHGDTSINFNDLVIMRTLGTGTFGRVKMVQHTPTRRVMALKCMQKAQVVASHQQTNVCSEKNAMLLCDHPLVLRLFRTFQDADSLYMLLELVQGGELWSLLYQNRTALPRSPQGGFQLGAARFYSACVVSAFAHVHSSNIAYRDLKPENLLVDGEGYLKVVDFGFAKQIPFLLKGRPSDKSYTLCGTPEYLSPELVLSKGHDLSVDYWALGVLIYELLCGGTPFADPQQPKIFEKVIHSSRFLRFPVGVDPQAQDIIRKLLEPNPSMRLGNLKGHSADVMAHPFFASIDWDRLAAKSLPAPFVPNIKNPLDSSNFDPYDEDDFVEPYVDDGTTPFARF